MPGSLSRRRIQKSERRFKPTSFRFGFRGTPGCYRAIVAAGEDDARASALLVLAIMGASRDRYCAAGALDRSRPARFESRVPHAAPCGGSDSEAFTAAARAQRLKAGDRAIDTDEALGLHREIKGFIADAPVAVDVLVVEIYYRAIG